MAISKITSDAIDATDFNLDSDTLTIDSTNNRVGVGTASPAVNFHIVDADNNAQIRVENNDGIAKFQKFEDDLIVTNTDTGDIIIKTGTGETERLRVDSSGNVGIGTTSPSSYYSDNLVVKCDVSEGGITIASNATTDSNYLMFADGTSGDAAYRGYIGYTHNSPENMQVASSGYTRFYTGDPKIERMRISATSNALSIGKTTFGTAGQGYTVYGNTAPQCYFNKSLSGAVNGVLFYHSDTYVGGLNYNNTNTSLATSSDERLKDNIENSDDAGAKIDAMQVRQFDWKSTGEHQEYSFVAQELESVFAHAVHTDLEGDYKSVDYACLVPMLVKEIQSLRQRIADLENA